MNGARSVTALLVTALLVAACGASSHAPSGGVGPGLGGTSWQLVKFEGGDGTVLTPDDPAKYTLAFNPDGSLAARLDCNRGRGTWTSPEPKRLELGPLALTRAMCPPGSLHDRIVAHWSAVRSYVLKDGHLFLSLMADGGIYEWAPLRTSTRDDRRLLVDASATPVAAHAGAIGEFMNRARLRSAEFMNRR